MLEVEECPIHLDICCAIGTWQQAAGKLLNYLKSFEQAQLISTISNRRCALQQCVSILYILSRECQVVRACLSCDRKSCIGCKMQCFCLGPC